MFKVYYADIADLGFPFDVNLIKSAARKEYLKTITAERRLKQSFYAWVLLEKIAYKLKFAGNNSLTTDFYTEEKGKWRRLDGAFRFSLSHSENVVAAAISDEFEVGLDVQIITEGILKLKNKFLVSEKDLSFYETLPEFKRAEFLTKKWTEKESEYKRGGRNSVYSSIKVRCARGNDYVLTVAAERVCTEFIKIDL